MVARMTSFTVPPSRFLIAFTWFSEKPVHVRLRSTPTWPLNGVEGFGPRTIRPSSITASVAAPISASARRGFRRRFATARAV